MGLLVEINGSTKSATARLREVYKKLKKTKTGNGFCETLENSPERYLITDKTDNFIQRGDRASYNDGFKTIVADPNYHPIVNTEIGPQAAPSVIVLGHEVGHAATGLTDGTAPEYSMDTVNGAENPIRDELGLPRRTTYP